MSDPAHTTTTDFPDPWMGRGKPCFPALKLLPIFLLGEALIWWLMS